MKAIPSSNVAAAAWNSFCKASRNAWLFHRYEWMELESRYFVRTNHSFGIEDHGQLIAVCPLYLSDSHGVSGTERLLHCGIHRHTGVALAPDLPQATVNAARAAAMMRIMEVAEREDADRIQMNVHNLTPESMGPFRPEIPFWVEDYGFELGLAFAPTGMMPAPGMATCNADQIVELDVSPDALFSRLEDRNAVRKAESSGLRCALAGGPDDLARYLRVAHLSAARTGEVLPPDDYYKDILARFFAEGQCMIVFAMKDEKVAAAVLLLVDKAGASYLAGASDPEFLHTRANDFVHWSALLWARSAGLRFYRLGPWFPTVSRDWPISKVSRFKKKFGGRSFTIIQGSLFRHPEKYRANAQAVLQSVFPPL